MLFAYNGLRTATGSTLAIVRNPAMHRVGTISGTVAETKNYSALFRFTILRMKIFDGHAVAGGFESEEMKQPSRLLTETASRGQSLRPKRAVILRNDECSEDGLDYLGDTSNEVFNLFLGRIAAFVVIAQVA
jgi:hypothetical protein